MSYLKYNKKYINIRQTFTNKRKKLLNFLSFQASADFYNHFYNHFFNIYLFRLLTKYNQNNVYTGHVNSLYLGQIKPKTSIIAYNNLNSKELLRSPFKRRVMSKNNYNNNIQFFYFKPFISKTTKTPFVSNISSSHENFLDKTYIKTKFDMHYDTSLLYYTWADFFSPGIFNYSPTRFWFLFAYTPSFIKYKSNWLVNSIEDFYLIFFFSKTFTLRLHKTIPAFLMSDLRLIFIEMNTNKILKQERNDLYQKSLEGIFEGLDFFSQVGLHDRENMLYFSGSWLDCLHSELYDEASTWIMPVKEEIDWDVFQGDLDDWWESLFYIFLSESYIWPFKNYSEQDFILEWKHKIYKKNIDLVDFLALDYSLEYIQKSPDFFFSNVIIDLFTKIWVDFLEGKMNYNVRVNHRFKIINKCFLTLNSWVLSGIAGQDRRVLLYRFFYLFVLKLRGFFFFWCMILLKPISYNLPWERELQHIEKIFATNQQFLKNKIFLSLRIDYEQHFNFFEQPFNFINFWHFFFNNIWFKLIIRKRNKIEPEFLLKIELLLQDNPKEAYDYSSKILKKVYISIFWDFFYYKPYYWYLIVQCFYMWWQAKVNSFESKKKLIFFFFDEADKLNNLNTHDKKFVFKYIKQTYNFANASNQEYQKLKLNLIFNFLLELKYKTRTEIELYWYLKNFKYLFIFQQAIRALYFLPLTIIKSTINIIISLLYEKIIDFNIGKVTRLVLNNNSEMWFKARQPVFFTGGVRKNVMYNNDNQNRERYTNSLSVTFILFTSKLDKVNWFFLVTLLFYYYPLKFVYLIVVGCFFTIRSIVAFMVSFYMYFMGLIINLKNDIRIYHDPKLKWNEDYYKSKERWKLKIKVKSKKSLTFLLTYNLYNNTIISNIHLHLKKAEEEYKKAKKGLSVFSKLTPFYIVGDLRPNNYIFYIKLFMSCSQILTAIIILVFFLFHQFLWIFRKNWNKWYFLKFLGQLFFTCIITSFFLFSILIIFCKKSIYLNKFLEVNKWWLYKAYSNLYYFVYIFSGKYFKIKNTNYLIIVKKIKHIIIKLNQLMVFFYFCYWSLINWSLSHFLLFRIVTFYLKQKELIYVSLNDLIWFLYYKCLNFLVNLSNLLAWFWSLLLLICFATIIICISFYDLVTAFYNIWYKKDGHDFIYLRAIHHFFMNELKESFSSFKEIIFVGTIALRFMLMLFGFFIYIIYQIGWRFRIYSSKKEKIKKMWSVPTKYRILRFLDKWVLYFFYRLRSWNFFNFKYLLFWWSYYIYYSLIWFLSKFFYISMYSLIWIAFFIQHEFPKLYIYVSKFFTNIYTVWRYFWYNPIFNFFFFLSFRFIRKKKKKIFKWTYIKHNKWFIKKLPTIWHISFLKWLASLYTIYRKCLNFLYILPIKSKKFNFLINLDLTVRDWQDLLVFINKYYNFFTFYWSSVLQISIEFGDFGWWLPYRKPLTTQHRKWRNFSFKTNQFISWKHYSWFFKENLYHKKHFYYFDLNKITKPLLRKKAFFNDSFYISNKNKLKGFDKVINSLFRFYHKIGIGFLLEVLYQRFKTPVSQYFFSNFSEYNKNVNLFLFLRMQKFKDTLGHLKWHLSTMRDNTKTLTLDTFGLLFITNFFKKTIKFNAFFKKKITFLFYPLINKTNTKLNLVFPYYRKVNIKAILTFFMFIISIVFSIIFYFSIIIFFFLCIIMLVFFVCWFIVRFFFFFFDYFVHFNKKHICFLLIVFFFIYLL